MTFIIKAQITILLRDFNKNKRTFCSELVCFIGRETNFLFFNFSCKNRIKVYLIMKKLLWLDDFRNPVDYVVGDYDINWVKNYEQFCTFINENGLPDIICFDHDLGEEKSGYDCAKFVVNYCQEHNLDTPSYDIQSSNIVGKDNIRSLMNTWHRVFKETKT